MKDIYIFLVRRYQLPQKYKFKNYKNYKINIRNDIDKKWAELQRQSNIKALSKECEPKK